MANGPFERGLAVSVTVWWFSSGTPVCTKKPVALSERRAPVLLARFTLLMM
jgi:hypothetical protein